MNRSLHIASIFISLILIISSTAAARPFKSFLGTRPVSEEHLALYRQMEDRLPLHARDSFPTFKLPAAPELTPIEVHVNSRGEVFLPGIPEFPAEFAGKTIGKGLNDEYVVFTVDSALQKEVEKTVKGIRASHAAIVIMEPKTGRILALADKTVSLGGAGSALQHAGFPAASLFKVVTSAAALEQAALQPDTTIRFRGGNYTLNKYNYAPSAQHDKREMTLEQALGKSCNPVFARVALQHLSRQALEVYSEKFGFNRDLGFDAPGLESSATIPGGDYELSRTAAGFGDVYISPIHAAAFMSAVANGGMLPRPTLVDRIISAQGHLLYRADPHPLQQVVRPATAGTLLEMLEETTTHGTSRYAFFQKGKPYMPGIRVFGKTGTLTGKNPAGLNKWFVGAAPLENPEVTVAVLVNNPHSSSARPSYLARTVLQKYFRSR